MLAAVVLVLSPIQATMITVGVLITADLITGIIAAWKRGETIQSSKLRNTIIKMVIYQLAIISAFLLETFILKSGDIIVKVVAGTIGITEFKSIIENLEKGTDTKLTKRITSIIKNWEAK